MKKVEVCPVCQTVYWTEFMVDGAFVVESRCECGVQVGGRHGGMGALLDPEDDPSDEDGAYAL